MLRKRKTMQQRWDDCITECRGTFESLTVSADRAEAWARTSSRFRVSRRLTQPLLSRAERQREIALESRVIADRMVTCSHNPRNGGTGFPPSPRFRDAFTLSDVVGGVLWLLPMLVGCIVINVVGILAIDRYHLASNFPQYLAVVSVAMSAGVGSIMMTQLVITGVVGTTRYVARYVRGLRRPASGEWRGLAVSVILGVSIAEVVFPLFSNAVVGLVVCLGIGILIGDLCARIL